MASQGRWVDRQEAVAAFFKGEVGIRAHDISGNQGLVIMHDPENYLYHIDKDGQIVKIPKGGWTMMDAIVPEIIDILRTEMGWPIALLQAYKEHEAMKTNKNRSTKLPKSS